MHDNERAVIAATLERAETEDRRRILTYILQLIEVGVTLGDLEAELRRRQEFRTRAQAVGFTEAQARFLQEADRRGSIRARELLAKALQAAQRAIG